MASGDAQRDIYLRRILGDHGKNPNDLYVKKVTLALNYALDRHSGQLRKSNEPFIEHPVEVASILAGKNLHASLIVAALLHDTIEDTNTDYNDLKVMFGRDIADIVDGVTNLTKLTLESSTRDLAANIHKLVLAVAGDERVILVKLADRLHNMRTIRHLSKEKQQLKAKETLRFYAPIAAQLGLYAWREELEDIAFEVLHPQARASSKAMIEDAIGSSGGDSDGLEQLMRSVKSRVESILQLNGLREFVVVSRIKKPYSVWRKIQKRENTHTVVADIFGMRIITSKERDVYIALGALHSEWKAVPGRFKDYISVPKQNEYRSVHTTVTHGSGNQIEFQIRTKLMHEAAEHGIAAHWVHHDGILIRNPYAVASSDWRNNLGQIVSEYATNSARFYKSFRESVFSNDIYCFGPNAQVVWLKSGATMLDFAYELGEEYGDKAVSAFANQKPVSLGTEVMQGQTINIIQSQIPFANETKKKSATTETARSSLKRLTARLERQSQIEAGRRYLKGKFEANGKPFSMKSVNTAAELFKLDSEEELLAEVGTRKISSQSVLYALYPDSAERQDPEVREPEEPFMDLKSGWTSVVAGCCGPVPQERVVGVESENAQVIVHRLDCDNLLKHDRLVDIHWHPGPFSAVHPTCIETRMSNQPGILGRICTIIGDSKANINDLKLCGKNPEFFDFRIEIEVRDHRHLFEVISAIEADAGALLVGRYMSAEVSLHSVL